jgi:hypothetical protein
MAEDADALLCTARNAAKGGDWSRVSYPRKVSPPQTA